METQKKFSQSVGAGIKSMFGSPGRTYCILEHKSSSDKHRAGERQEIIVDQITLGRDSACQVTFGNSFPTVSRKHATITRQDNNWVIRHTGSNPTLVNGRPVAKEWFLQNGDEIQLSYEGPKLGFLIPQNPSVKSINISRRLSLFRQQALRPYKTAITVIAAVFLVAIGVLSFFLVNTMISNRETVVEMEKLRIENQELLARAEQFTGNMDSLKREIVQNRTTQRRLEAELGRMREISENLTTGGATGNAPPPSMDPLFPSVYFIMVDRIEIEFGGSRETVTDVAWMGSGFLLDDKRFVTARHVIEAWHYDEESEAMIILNFIANNGGKVVAYFTASSPDGTKISFNSDQFRYDKTGDRIMRVVDEEGNPMLLRYGSLDNGEDWAVATTNKTGLIPFDNQLSRNLPQQSQLHILGYPRGIGATDRANISPIYGSCIVASSGLSNNLLNVSNRNFTNGNSGGPVFALRGNQYVAVGLVSAGMDNLGFIIPIAAAQ